MSSHEHILSLPHEFHTPTMESIPNSRQTFLPCETKQEVDDPNSIDSYLHQIGEIPLLTAREEIELGRKVRDGQQARKDLTDPQLVEKKRPELLLREQEGFDAKAHFVSANLRLAVSVAKKYATNGIPLKDLIQEANIAVINAVDKFDPEKNLRFSTLATMMIRQAILESLAEDKLITLSVGLNNSLHKLRKIQGNYMMRHGQPPDLETLRMLYDQTKFTKKVIFDTAFTFLQIKQNFEPVSLNQPLPGEEDYETTQLELLEDRNFDLENLVIDSLVRQNIVDTARTILTREEWEVIKIRFGLERNNPHTHVEIGELIGLSRDGVSSIESRALAKLKAYLLTTGFEK